MNFFYFLFFCFLCCALWRAEPLLVLSLLLAMWWFLGLLIDWLLFVKRYRLHIIDLDPSSVTSGGWLEDTSLVEKYSISEEAYEKRDGKVFKKLILFIWREKAFGWKYLFTMFKGELVKLKTWNHVIDLNNLKFSYFYTFYIFCLFQALLENLREDWPLKIHQLLATR